MDELQYLQEINYGLVFLSAIAILIAIKFLVSLFEWFINKLGLETKGMRQKRQDHELLIKTSENLAELKNKHDHDDCELKECLSSFIEETKRENEMLRNEMRQFSENRIHDRQQSFEIQKELTDSIKVIVDGQEDRDKQIEALMCGSKELLGDTIDQRYAKYISLGGIPQNEVDEFDDLYVAYKRLHGNHGRDAKYDYVKEHLPVIPVEVTLKK